MDVTGTPVSGESAANNLKPKFKRRVKRAYNPKLQAIHELMESRMSGKHDMDKKHMGKSGK